MKIFFLAIIAIFILTTPAQSQGTKITKIDLKSVQPSADQFSGKKILDSIEYFEAMKDADTIGYCIFVTGSGYCGPINIIVGIDKSGIIQGMKILGHVETAGIGSRITEKSFLEQFKGKNASDLSIGKNIDAVTGATISSKVVIDSINDTAKRFISLKSGHQLKLQKK